MHVYSVLENNKPSGCSRVGNQALVGEQSPAYQRTQFAHDTSPHVWLQPSFLTLLTLTSLVTHRGTHTMMTRKGQRIEKRLAIQQMALTLRTMLSRARPVA